MRERQNRKMAKEKKISELANEKYWYQEYQKYQQFHTGSIGCFLDSIQQKN